MHLVANARMYAVTEVAAAGWQTLFRWVTKHSGIELEIVSHPPPAPLSELWGRQGLGCVFMCGWPFARAEPRPHFLAAPVPSPERYADQPIYFTDIVVHRDSRFRTLEDTFGGVVGWTLEDSHSGFNALRHYLLGFRTEQRRKLYRGSIGGLLNPVGALRAVAEGRADVAPVDSLCHDLLKAQDHPVTKLTRTIATTPPSPIPGFVASADVPVEIAERIGAALLQAHLDPALAPVLNDVLVRRFVRPDLTRYDYGEQLAQAALASDYPTPA